METSGDFESLAGSANLHTPWHSAQRFHSRTGRCLTGNHLICAAIEDAHRAGEHSRCLPAECHAAMQAAPEQPEPPPEREVLRDPQAFETGYERALSLAEQMVRELPFDMATKTRDEGRGASFAIDLLLAQVHRLQGDRPW